MTQNHHILLRKIKLGLYLIFFLLINFQFASATSYTWSGGTGDWSVATNWTPNGVPSTGDDVIINTGTVTLDIVATVLTISMGGGDLVLDNALTVSDDATLASSSSEISGAGDLTINGDLIWDGGTIGGTGTFSLTGTYSSGAFNNTLDGRSLTLTAGGTFTYSNLDLDNNATLTIPSGQTFTMDITGAGLKEIKGDGTGTVINNGTIAVTGTGSPRFRDVSLTNNNSITLNAGGLSFGAGTHTHDGATITVASGNILKFEGGTSTFQNSTAISGAGSIYINSSIATLNLNAGSSISNDVDLAQGLLVINTVSTFPSLDLTAGGDLTLNANLTVTGDMTLASSTSIIDGDSDLSIGGDFTWTSGTISGNGNVTVSGSLNGTSVGTLETKTLTLNAGGTLTNHTFTLKSNSKIVIPSGQTLTIDNSSSKSFTASSGNFGTIENNGTIEKNGVGELSIIYNTFDNNGVLNINNGTIYQSTGSSSTHDNGTVTIASGATYRFAGNTHDITNTSVSGDGLFKQQGGTVNINAGCTFGPAIEMTGGTMNLHVASSVPSLSISGGDLILNANLIVTGDVSLTGNGTEISGSGDLTINGTLNWNGGTVSGSGNFTLNGTLALLGTSDSNLDTRNLSLTAGATWTNADLDIENGATVTVPAGQTLTIDNSSTRTTTGTPGTPGSIINNGTIIKNGAGEYGINHNNFDNNGTLTVNAGILNIGTSANSTHDGATITIAAGTEFELSGPSTTHTFDNTTISGAGTFKLFATTGTASINSGSSISTNIIATLGTSLTLNVDATVPSVVSGVNVILNANLTVTGDVSITGATTAFSGPGNLAINGNLDWGSGTISGSGSLTVGGTMTADNGNTVLDTRSLSLTGGGYISNGNFTMLNGANLTVPSGQVLTLHRAFGDGYLKQESITIDGTIEKTGAGNYTFQHMFVDNNGTINVSAGKLLFTSGFGTGTSDHTSATISVAAGAEIDFKGFNAGSIAEHDFSNSTITGSGTFTVEQYAKVNWNSGTTISSMPIVIKGGGILNPSINVTVPSFTFGSGGGTLSGTFTSLDITGDLTWALGTMGSSNVSTITVGGVMTQTSTNFLSKSSMILNGGGTSTLANCTLQEGANITIPAGQTLTFSNTSNRNLYNGTGGGTLTNNGTLVKSGTAIFNIDVPYTAASGSTTDIQAGTLDFNNTVDNDGTIKGTGTLDISGATVNDYGTFAPGSSPGTLNITGDYVNDVLDIEIVNGSPVLFDKLVVSGTVTLGGTLNLTETGNVPAGTYNIVSGASVSGSFATLNLPACYFIEVSGGNVNLTKGVAKVWDGSNGTWSTANSWLPNGVPCQYDDVIINAGVCDVNIPPEMSSLTINGGTMALTNGSTYTVDVTTTVAIAGKIQIESGELDFNGILDNNGTIGGFGTIDITGATIVGGSGIYSPGASAGTLTVKGTHTNEEIQMEIGGTGGGVVKDLLEVTQSIVLGGEFNLGYLGGTVPAGTYEMMHCNGGPNCVSGNFTTVTFPSECQGNCNLEITGTSVRLVNTQPIQFTGECTWLGGTGNWTDQTNWSCNDVPNSDDDVIINSGQLTLAAPVAMKTCALNGGEITGSGNFTVTESLTWAGGTLGPTGNHNIGSIAMSGSCFLSEGTLILDGTGTWENANLQLSNGSTFKIGPGETMTVNLSTNHQINAGAGGGTFENDDGIFIKTGGGDLSVNIPFVSTGVTNLLDGVLNLNNIFNNLGGTLIGVAYLDVADATVQDFGTVSPGSSPGILTVLGNFQNNILRYEIEEQGSSVNHDLLIVTQNATLAGTLDILHLGGTIPYGDYPIVNCSGACSGAFANVIYPAFCAGECSIAYSPTGAVLHYSMVPLPVELLHFRGFWENESVQLHWQTASETDHDGFYIEKSTDGAAWRELGFVAGKGSPASGSAYTFHDAGPAKGKNYYRLRMRSLAGDDEFSGVVLVDVAGDDWHIYPNPAKDELFLTFPNDVFGHVRLYDWTGRMIASEQVDGRATIRLDMASLPPGTYCLRLNDGAGRIILKQ